MPSNVSAWRATGRCWSRRRERACRPTLARARAAVRRGRDGITVDTDAAHSRRDRRGGAGMAGSAGVTRIERDGLAGRRDHVLRCKSASALLGEVVNTGPGRQRRDASRRAPSASPAGHRPRRCARNSRHRRAIRRSYAVEVPDGEDAKDLPVADFAWTVLGKVGFTRNDLVDRSRRWRRRPTSPGSSRRPGCAACGWCTCRPRCWRWSTRPSAARPAINTDAGKNLVGAFHQPAAVLCDLGDARRRCPPTSSPPASPRWSRPDSSPTR